jgi:hypothetical protein
MDDSVATITQKELIEYLKWKLEIDKTQKKIDNKRQEFIDRAGLGAMIEDGALILKIESQSPRINSSLIIQEVAKRYGETVAQDIEKMCKKDSGSKRVLVEARNK